MATDYTAWFNLALERYRTAMSDYRMTGNPGSKTTADAWKTWATQYIQSLEGTVAANSSYLNRFVAEYSTTNPDLVAMQTKLQSIKTEGPALENTYRTNNEAAETTPRDFTPYYVKGGVILGVAALLAVLSL